MIILPRQIRAARALLDWTTEDLARRVGISKSAVSYIESGKNKPSGETLEAMIRAFLTEGVFFTAQGVELRDGFIERLEGKDGYMTVLEHARQVLQFQKSPEILFHCAVEDDLFDQALALEHAMRAEGVRIRKTVSGSGCKNPGFIADYRRIPEDYTETCRMKTVVYDKYTIQDLGDSLMRIHSARLAGIFRSQFEYWWQRGARLEPRP